MKIYTKTGDAGETSLYNNDRVSKDNVRLEAIGEIDEIISWLGVFYNDTEYEYLKTIQIQLMQINYQLALPTKEIEVDNNDIDYMEDMIDTLTNKLPKINKFILPNNLIHVCRAKCRTAERRIVSIGDFHNREYILKYINRLSDYLFQYARYYSQEAGYQENLWDGKK